MGHSEYARNLRQKFRSEQNKQQKTLDFIDVYFRSNEGNAINSLYTRLTSAIFVTHVTQSTFISLL